tara:strand:- start:242 stop:571 length:330 start_codon:yes stop_codon:yes gene_type:complete
MIWPPVKAWTSKNRIEGQRHFVAINYGGKPQERWVVLMSVLDSSVLVRVDWSQLVDLSNWECGWDENNYSDSSELLNSKCKKRTTNFSQPSVDSGLIIPITNNFIRPWF